MNASVSTHPLDLTGKVAIVTGGNRGIGLGMAKGLSAAGCHVAIWGRDPEQNQRAVDQCAGQRGEVAAFGCDVVSAEAVDYALEQTLARFGRVDGLFANAGIGGGGRTPFVEQTEADWQRMVDVNLLGTRRTLLPVLRRMVEQAAGGRIVITSSVAATIGAAYNEHYAATKAGLVAIARAIAVEYGRFGITANAVLPGYVKTEMIGELLDNEKFLDRVRPRLPLRRLGAVDDLAGIAIYLMSDLSSYHTGDAITVDGGFTIS
jgi:NAD(P)-dependent dehydrogenase (short-subunit alcohol dehydrogenase family)